MNQIKKDLISIESDIYEVGRRVSYIQDVSYDMAQDLVDLTNDISSLEMDISDIDWDIYNARMDIYGVQKVLADIVGRLDWIELRLLY